MTKSFNCPSCGAKGEFYSPASLFVVCQYCKASIVRNENELINLGKISEVAEDNSPLQLGSMGEFASRSFTVIGRIRYQWSDGFWNEWHLFFNDGTSGWLAEAQGDFFLNREYQASELPAQHEWVVGARIFIDEANFMVTDVKNSEVQMSEGELPFRAHAGDKRKTADLRPVVGVRFATLELDLESRQVSCYLGSAVSLQQLKMKNLRVHDDWK
jgi:hypothetical protein